MMQMLTCNHAMHRRSRVFTEGYTSIPKYTPHLESSRGKLLGLSLRDLTPLLNLPPLGSFHFFFPFNFCPFRGLLILISISYNHFFNLSFSSHKHDAYEVQSHHISTPIIFQDNSIYSHYVS